MQVSHQMQKNYVERKIHSSQEEIAYLLSKHSDNMSAHEFINFTYKN